MSTPISDGPISDQTLTAIEEEARSIALLAEKGIGDPGESAVNTLRLANLAKLVAGLARAVRVKRAPSLNAEANYRRRESGVVDREDPR